MSSSEISVPLAPMRSDGCPCGGILGHRGRHRAGWRTADIVLAGPVPVVSATRTLPIVQTLLPSGLGVRWSLTMPAMVYSPEQQLTDAESLLAEARRFYQASLLRARRDDANA